MKNREFAKYLRKQDVSAESRLWQALRNRRCGGYKFIRQMPIAGYVVDFACRQVRVAVEVDGPSHLDRPEYDIRRSEEISSCGYQVIRLTNEDIYDDLDASVEAIFNFLEVANGRGDEHPHPTASRPPSPSKEKEGSISS